MKEDVKEDVKEDATEEDVKKEDVKEDVRKEVEVVKRCSTRLMQSLLTILERRRSSNSPSQLTT